ncbi:MAG: glycoside hydrolase family 16 protein [Myxococcales bacterium]|nr:glycoside hydrolase family 16 protein [Myxococcales bacterium]
MQNPASVSSSRASRASRAGRTGTASTASTADPATPEPDLQRHRPARERPWQRSPRRSARALGWAFALLIALVASPASAAESGVTVTSSSSVQFFVRDAAWADLHYQINGGTQLNVRMVASGANHAFDVGGLSSGTVLRYFFTIGLATGAVDTAPTQTTFSPTTTPPPPPPPTGGWAVVWEDTFDGNGQPNSANWNYHVGNGLNPGIGAFSGWGNGEWEWYRPENAFRQNGNLVIRADYGTTATTIAGRQWFQRSGRITTKGKRSWQFGRIEARIAMPNAIGTWPAFWMMGTSCDDTVTSDYNAPITRFDTMASNWSSCGEIDIMEHRNTEAVTFQNLFWDSRTGLFPWADGQNNEQPHQANVGDVTQFHLYSIEWDANEIRWYVDRETRPTPVHVVSLSAANKEEFKKPFHIIMNLALSGQFTGFAEPNRAQFPLTMTVDFVRVWQRQ